MEQKIIIIGAGISGLVAGVYARKNGFETEIYEALPNAGGECTGWDRGGYHFDGCIDWLTGSAPGSDVHTIWEECGALDSETRVLRQGYHIALNDGEKLYYTYTDFDKLRSELLAVSPEDKDHIEFFIKMIQKFRNLSMPAKKPMELLSFGEKMKLASRYITLGSAMKAGSKITAGELLAGFRSQKIRMMLSDIVPMQCSATALFATLGGMCSGDGGWPAGGSAAFANRIKEKYLSLGGKLHLNTRVTRIVIEKGAATGIAVQEGDGERVIPADFVVPAVDAKILLDKLLGGKYKEEFFTTKYKDRKSYYLFSMVNVYLGVNADLSALPAKCVFRAQKPIDVGGGMEENISFKHFCGTNFAPKGKSCVTVSTLNASYDYWKNLKDTSEEAYRAEKKRLADEFIRELSAVYSPFENVEVVDVVTPVTYERYCGAYRGSFMSFMMTPGANQKMFDGKIGGIRNLSMAGQWTGLTGGLPTAAVAGKFAIQRICNACGKPV